MTAFLVYFTGGAYSKPALAKSGFKVYLYTIRQQHALYFSDYDDFQDSTTVLGLLTQVLLVCGL